MYKSFLKKYKHNICFTFRHTIWPVKYAQVAQCFFKFNIKVNEGVHQGSVLRPLLFIIVLEALSREFRTGYPWELLYAGDLVISDEDLIKLEEMLCTWKRNLKSHGLRVNMGKIKVMTRSGAQVPSWYISIDIQPSQNTYIYLSKQKIGN